MFGATWGLAGERAVVQGFSNFSQYQNHPEGLLKHRLLAHTPRVSCSRGLIICLSHEIPG